MTATLSEIRDPAKRARLSPQTLTETIDSLLDDILDGWTVDSVRAQLESLAEERRLRRGWRNLAHR